MSAILTKKIAGLEEFLANLKSVKGSTIFKEDLKSSYDQEKVETHLDENGNELVDEDGNPYTRKLDPPQKISDSELQEMVERDYKYENYTPNEDDCVIFEGVHFHETPKEKRRVVFVCTYA